MLVNGIIAEYNPFHNGHQYHLEESRRLTGADYTIVVMSGNFVQRGAPAMADKRMRAETALRCGADLVLELPALYAASSAEYFANGAVAMLDKLGVVTHLSFGSECGDTGQLTQIARILSEEPPKYRSALKDSLKKGLSFPHARTCALLSYSPELEGCRETLSSPNNILGADYIRALLRRRSKITPVTIQRLGSGYHDLLPIPHRQPMRQGRKLPSAKHPPGQDNPAQRIDCTGHSSVLPALPDSCSHGEDSASFCSAHAIREALWEGYPLSRLCSHMPKEAARLLQVYMKEHKLMQADDFSALLYYKLLAERENGYEKYLDVTADLSNRIQNRLDKFNGFSGFCSLLKTKDMTYTRISRCLLHILLGMEKEHMALGKSLADAPYARVLGFRKSAVPLLRAIKDYSSLRLVTKLADGEKSLGQDACRLLQLDIRTSQLYLGISAMKCAGRAPNEFSIPLVIL